MLLVLYLRCYHMHCCTGETGAGKSLLSGAFALAAGGKPQRGASAVGRAGSVAKVQLELELHAPQITAVSQVGTS